MKVNTDILNVLKVFVSVEVAAMKDALSKSGSSFPLTTI